MNVIFYILYFDKVIITSVQHISVYSEKSSEQPPIYLNDCDRKTQVAAEWRRKYNRC